MKKILVIMLCCSFLLAGCGNSKKDTLANPKEEQIIENVLSFTIESVEFNKTIEPPILSGYYTYYYEVKNSTNTFADAIISIKNLSEESITPSSLLKSTFTIDKNNYTADYVVVSEDGTSVSTTGTIEPQQEMIMHICTEISNIPDTFTLAIQVDEVVKKFEIDVASFENTKNYKNYGDNLSSEGLATVSIQEMISIKKLNPTAPTTFYYFFEVKDQANTFIGLKLRVKNDGTEGIPLEKSLGFRAIFDSDIYGGYAIIEYPSGSNLATSYTLAAGEEVTVYLVAEVPDTVIESSAEFSLYFQGEYYYITK